MEPFLTLKHRMFTSVHKIKNSVKGGVFDCEINKDKTITITISSAILKIFWVRGGLFLGNFLFFRILIL